MTEDCCPARAEWIMRVSTSIIAVYFFVILPPKRRGAFAPLFELLNSLLRILLLNLCDFVQLVRLFTKIIHLHFALRSFHDLLHFILVKPTGIMLSMVSKLRL